jgi:hypothetical protein
MSWLSKATGIHIGGNFGISKFLNKGWRAVKGPLSWVSPLTWAHTSTSVKDRASAATQGDMAGTVSGVSKDVIEKGAKAAEAAALKKAHDEEVASLGAGAAEALRNKRRRGLYATILTGSGPTMGSPGSSSGKSTLGS